MKVGREGYVFLMGMTIFFLMFFYPLQGQASERSPKFMVFIQEPMAGTYKEAYPEIEELYASDNQLVLVTYDRVSKSGTHLVKVQVENADGERIYDESKEIKASDDKQRPYIQYIVPFDEAFKAKLKPVFVTIRFSLDGKAYEARQIRYHAQNPMRQVTAKIIVLPFYSSTNTLFDYYSKDAILSTFADAIGCEIKRIFRDVVPFDGVRSRLSGVKIQGCFKDPACLKILQETYGEGIYITGDILLPKLTGGFYTKEARFTLYVFNTRTGDEKIFKSVYIITGRGEKEADVMKKLMVNAFFQEGFLLYLRALL
jgi:hypothetical protein